MKEIELLRSHRIYIVIEREERDHTEKDCCEQDKTFQHVLNRGQVDGAEAFVYVCQERCGL